jgi:hypothetical protein
MAREGVSFIDVEAYILRDTMMSTLLSNTILTVYATT